jgi:hypothetical protein
LMMLLVVQLHDLACNDGASFLLHQVCFLSLHITAHT